jgi:hypothetical protein
MYPADEVFDELHRLIDEDAHNKAAE